MNLTQAARKANLKRWKAQGPAIIASPLKAIRAEFPDLKSAAGGFVGHHPTYAEALHAATRGDGDTVKAIARGLQ